MRRKIWQFLLPIHHDVSSDRAWWLPYREPCVSCQSPASAGLGSPGDSRSHSGQVGNTRRRRLITCCRLWPAAQRFWLGLHLLLAFVLRWSATPPFSRIAWRHGCLCTSRSCSPIFKLSLSVAVPCFILLSVSSSSSGFLVDIVLTLWWLHSAAPFSGHRVSVSARPGFVVVERARAWVPAAG